MTEMAYVLSHRELRQQRENKLIRDNQLGLNGLGLWRRLEVKVGKANRAIKIGVEKMIMNCRLEQSDGTK